MSKQPVIFSDLGNMDYQQAWDYQERLLAENLEVKARKWHKETPALAAGDDELTETRHHLLFVEHPPVYTIGKSGNIENVLISEEDRIKNNLEVFRINRGGDITFHGPGQLVAYPIFDLEKFYTDIGKYMRNLEEVIIRTLSDYGILAGRSKGETGVWIDPEIPGRERKICAIGIRCSRWVTMHGFAFNVNTDLDYFNNIVPCGIRNKKVASLSNELSRSVDMEEIKEIVRKYFEEIFDVELLEEQL